MRFKDWHTLITAADAEQEPLDQQLFGPAFERRQRQLRGLSSGIDRDSFSPWKKPRILRAQNSSERKGVDDRETAQ
jgi:hypothetical protein